MLNLQCFGNDKQLTHFYFRLKISSPTRIYNGTTRTNTWTELLTTSYSGTIVRLVKRGLMDRTSGVEYLDFLGLIVRRRSRLLITQLADNEKHPSSQQ